MFLRRKTLQDESKFEKFEIRLKTSTYALMHELLQAQISTPLIYNIILLIEAIQFFWFTIHSSFSFLWTVDVATWLRSAVKYFQVDGLIRENNESLFLILLYAFFFLQLILVLVAIGTAIYLAKAKRKTSTVLTYSLKTLSVFGLLINHVFALPLVHIFLLAIICNDNDGFHGGMSCYQGIYFLHFVVGIFGFLISFIVCLLFTMLYTELNPFSPIPFASPQSKLNIGKFLLKIVVALYFTLDYKANLVKGFIAVYGVIWLAILVFKYRQTPCYNKTVFRVSNGLDSIILWGAIVAIVHAFIDTSGADDIGLFFLFFGTPFAAYAAITIIGTRPVAFRKVIVKNLNKDGDVEMYLNTIFNLIEKRERPDHKMALEGLLKHHIKHCNKKDGDCVCYTLSRDFAKDEEAPEKLWYTWIKSIIVDVLEKFPKSARLHILYAYVQREKLNNKFKALFEMMIAKDNKPSVEQEFAIFRYKSLIEEEIIEEDSRNSETKGIDVNVIVHFQNTFVAFQAALENAVELHLEFWRELLENNPGIYKLQSLGSMITHSVEEIGDRYKKLNDINPNHIKMLQSYGNFLKNIVNDDVEGQRVLEKADYVVKSSVVNKQFIENDRLKYGENSNTCIVTVSGNSNGMGTIKNVNNEVTRILGFAKADLIGQNVNRIIPKYLSELHDTLMRNYFETSESKVMGVERFVFPLSKKGYVVPCTLMIKVLPDLERGVRLVGFLNDVENETTLAKNADLEAEDKAHYIVYSGDTGAIHGFTQSCKKAFGLPSSLIYGAAASNDFTIDVIFPELAGCNLEDLKNSTGVMTTLDTSTLQQDYLLAHSESEKSEYEEGEEEDEEAEERRYRKTNVRVVVVEDSVYLNLNVRVLRFTEIISEENGGLQRPASVRDENGEREKGTAAEGVPNSNVEVEPERFSPEEGGSDKDSNHSVADVAGEELKQLKDFKALISEKTEPKSIKTLSRAIILLMLILVTLACVDLGFKLKQANEFNDGLDSIVQAYQRHNLMANINFKIRQLNLLARGLYYTSSQAVNDATTLSLKTQLISLIDDLSSVQFDIMKATELLKADGATTYDSDSIILENQLETSVSSESRIYTDAVFQYITAASSIRNSTLSDINGTKSVPAVKNFYFVRRNGLGPLREGSEAEADNFYNYYLKKSNSYNTLFMVLMIVGLVLLVASELILIPIVFSVHKTNNRVLSLFGFIPTNEIDELAAKCEEYMQNYLEDHKERRDYSFEQSEEGNDQSQRPEHLESSYLEVSQNPDGDENQPSPDMSLQLDVSEQVRVSPTPLFKSDNLKVPANLNQSSAKGGQSRLINSTPGAVNKSTANLTASQQDKYFKNKEALRGGDNEKSVLHAKGDEKKKDEAEQEAELAEAKSTKLLNSKDNRRSKVMIQFIGIAILFSLYFFLNYLWIEKSFISNLKLNLQHLKFSAQRVSQIRYLVAFTLEEIAEADYTSVYKYTDGTSNLRLQYQTLLQTNNKNITSPANLDFDGTFNSYLNEFNTYTNGDLCALYYAPLGKQTACSSLGSGLLSSGITLTITTISLDTSDADQRFWTAYNASVGATAQNATQAIFVNDTKLLEAENGMDMVMAPLETLITDFGTTYKSFLTKFKQGEIIKFVVYLCFCFFVFVILWLPYRKNLGDKIFRTKGMLNMIPMEIITKNESLKNTFLDGGILQGVK